MDPWSMLYMVIVAMIWGFTNPMMKRSAKGIETCSGGGGGGSWFSNFVLELKFLITNWKYLLAYLLNQSGSVLFYYTLGQVDLSIASPVTNTLTFIFTYASGILFFGEKDEDVSLEKRIGLSCVCSEIPPEEMRGGIAQREVL